MAERFRPVTINIAAVNVAGGPGLSLLALVVAIAYQFPEARWLLFSGVTGGVLLGREDSFAPPPLIHTAAPPPDRRAGD
jgi:hypothetical protein